VNNANISLDTFKINARTSKSIPHCDLSSRAYIIMYEQQSTPALTTAENSVNECKKISLENRMTGKTNNQVILIRIRQQPS